MDNTTIAKTLNEYADLLEIADENPFRVRSYRQAAQTVEGLSRPLQELVEDSGELQDLPGIGDRMEEHLEELVRTGSLSALDELREKLPGSLSDVVGLKGVGPKRARKLHEVLGVESVQDLKQAVEDDKVTPLEGFGEKTVEQMMQAVDESEEDRGRWKLSTADQLIEPLVKHLKQADGVDRVVVAGSYRRRQETVGDADILVTTDGGADVMKHFHSYKEVERIDSSGETRSTVVLGSGLQVDLRVVEKQRYGAALHYFTGSREHNVAIRKRGIERGLRINEYGVFRLSSKEEAEEARGKEAGDLQGGTTEKEVFESVELPWIPPELRLNRGEIEAAENGELPSLVEPEQIRGDLHMHTQWSDGKNTVEEMARACKDGGYQYCAITDHSQESRVAGGLEPGAFRDQREEIEEARSKVRGIHILAGAEVDILPDGNLDLPDGLLREFDIVVASVHSKLGLEKDEMTKRVIRAIEHPSVDIIGHLTTRQINDRGPASMDFEDIFRAAKANNVALEINSQPQRLDLPDVHARRAAALGVKFVIDSDAHRTESLRYVKYGVDQARRAWLTRTDVRNTSTWKQLKRWLGRKR